MELQIPWTPELPTLMASWMSDGQLTLPMVKSELLLSPIPNLTFCTRLSKSGNSNSTLPAGQIGKLRCYLWLSFFTISGIQFIRPIGSNFKNYPEFRQFFLLLCCHLCPSHRCPPPIFTFVPKQTHFHSSQREPVNKSQIILLLPQIPL